MATNTARALRLAATASLALVAVSFGVVILAPDAGYRAAILTLIDPVGRSRQVTVEDIQRRGIDFDIDYFGFRYRGTTTNLIDAHAYYFGAYERPELQFLGELLQRLGPDAVFVDVGANTGLHTLFASRYARHIHAFEPYPPVLLRLRSALEENGVTNVVVHPVGLGVSEATVPFFAPPDENQGTGSFIHEFAAGGGEKVERLRLVAGDVYFAAAGVPAADVIKMDIEGSEKAALVGLRGVLERDRPVVLVEITVEPGLPTLFSSDEELRAHFPDRYAFSALSGRDLRSGAYRLDPLRLSFERAGRANVVAYPVEYSDLMRLASSGVAEAATPP